MPKSTTGTERRRKRRDAQDRRERLLQSAIELFASEGFDVALEKVASHAGVGRGTLYRNFPDRELLAEAVLQAHLDDLSAKVASWSDRDDAFMLAIRTLATRAVSSGGFQKISPLHIHAPAFTHLARRGYERILSAPLERAKAAGLIRRDFKVSDVYLLTLMIAAGGIEDLHGNADVGMERALALVMSGVGAQVESPKATSRRS